MKHTNLTSLIARLLASLGVIVSLVFVGLELRQATVVARAQARQALADRNSEIVFSIAENPALARAWVIRWSSAPPPNEVLTLTDSLQSEWAMTGVLRHLENVYLQQLEGVVDSSVLDTYSFKNSRWYRTPQFADYWSLARVRFDTRFVTAFELEYGI